MTQRASLIKRSRANTAKMAGFTIVELIIVIVVIAILAAIVIVSYNGITQHAIESSMQQDLQNGATAIELDKVTRGSYASSASILNDGNGLKQSGDNQISYLYGGGSAFYGVESSYCISITNTKTSDSYHVYSNDKQIASGTCAAWTTSVAGSDNWGFQDGTLWGNALFSGTDYATTDASGNIYISDVYNYAIRKVTPAGIVTTLAGNGSSSYAEGTGTTARFRLPQGIDVDSAGNVYVADKNDYRIRKITPAGTTSTFAGSGVSGATNATGASAQFSLPYDVAVDASGNLYIADCTRVRKITPAQVVTTLAGSGISGTANGTGTGAQFMCASAVDVDSSGNVYVADTDAHQIRKITPAGVTSTLAGSTQGYAEGTGSGAQFNRPSGIAVDPSTGTVYVCDRSNNRIRAVTSTGVTSTFTGGNGYGYLDGPNSQARFMDCYGVRLGADNLLYIGEEASNRVRAVAL